MNYTNILGLDKEEVIIDVINSIKNELKDLTTDRTCKIYSDYVSSYLRSKYILNRNIDTGEFGCDYSHKFCLVPKEEDYYLIDLTYSQFNNLEFLDLLIDGYMIVNKEELKRYIEIVGKSKKDISVDTLFFSKGRSK